MAATRRLVLFLAALVCALSSRAEPPPAGAPALTEKPITAEERSHWAFVAPKAQAMPRVKQTTWVRNPIDAFVLAALEENALSHAPEADRTTLLRRLRFDLTGLPPTPGEIDDFLADKAPDAYERLVDRLLARPEHGQRWAQHWLDLARYADSDGFEFDQARDDAWRYRDWVVDALNRDLPYDAFVRLQLAGDESDPDDSSAFIATGFNRCYPDMVDLNDQGLRRQNALNDITETAGLAFLGLTIGCARCHDHKFDPIRQSDFYRLQAFFTPARFRDDFPVVSKRDRSSYERRLRAWEARRVEIEEALIRLEASVRDAFAPGPPPGANTDDVIAAFQKTEAERSPQDVKLVFDAQAKDRRITPEIWAIALDRTARSIRARLLAHHAEVLRAAPPRLPYARGLDEVTPKAPPTYFLRRGDHTAKGPEVPPAFPRVLCATDFDAIAVATPSATSSGRRKALADWLLCPDHPLTSRVMVNRLWQHHFGRGIVATPSDFGMMGAEPSHPELLDWLALEFKASGWSLKAMHRLIVTSASYRQAFRADRKSEAADPENSLLWRHSRQRLDGEAIRDALLAVSGRLHPAFGGPPVFPRLPSELTKLSSKGAVWPVSARIEDRQRRSLYVFVRRNLRFPFFEAFDRPDTNASCPRRAVTTIAPQALTLLNGEIAAESARALADRVRREAGSDRDAQVRRAYLLAFGRPPDAVERRLSGDFLGRDPSLARFCLALINVNEFLYVD